MMRSATALFATCLAALAQDATDAAAAVVVTGVLLTDGYEPADGVPIAHVFGEAPDYAAAVRAPLARSGADGAFRVRVELAPDAANYVLIGGRRFAVHRHYLSTNNPLLDVGTLTLARGFPATGRVRTADGGAPTGARVIGDDLLASRRFLGSSRRSSAPTCHTETAVQDSGIFVLPGMVRSAGRVTVRCPGYYDRVVQPVAVGAPLDVTLEPAPTVRGRVVDADGAPVAGQRVYCGSVNAVSGEDGHFELQRRDATVHEVHTLAHSGGRYTRVAVPLGAPEEAVELQVDVDPAAAQGELRVTAKGADGEPLQEFEVYVAWHHESQRRHRAESSLLGTSATREGLHAKAVDGVATLQGPRSQNESSAIVFVRAPGHGWGRAETDVDALGKEPLIVALPRPVALAGRVVDKKTGAGIAGVQVVPSHKLEDQARQFVTSGFYKFDGAGSCPDTVVTDADGRWRLDGLPPAELDLFVCLDDQIVGDPRALDLQDGKAPDGELKLEIPGRATLAGRVAGADVPGLRIRLHWHRENMSSSGWLGETDGSIPLAPDGTFRWRDLTPLQYRPEVLLPAPPRSRMMRKLYCEVWDGTDPPEGRYEATIPKIRDVRGRVGGDVPWSRLAVLAIVPTPNTVHSSFAPPATAALLEPDRSFRMLAPAEETRLVLVDVLTGVALAWRDLDADSLSEPITWTGAATPVDVELRSGTPGRAHLVYVTYTPPEEHWPVEPHPFVPQQARRGMTTDVRTGEAVRLWLPALVGDLKFERGGQELLVGLRPSSATRLTIDVDEDGLQQRQR